MGSGIRNTTSPKECRERSLQLKCFAPKSLTKVFLYLTQHTLALPLTMAEQFKVKKLSKKSVLPSRASHLSVSYDLSSAQDAIVPARGKALVQTDLSIGIPKGTYARIATRFALARKHSVHVGAGVVDADYRGRVGVILFNHSDVDCQLNAGDRIAQLIVEMIMIPEQLKVEKLSEKAVLPSRASHLSAGYDLSSAQDVIVPARGKALVQTDLSIAVPEGTYARIAPRSGLAWKHSIDVGDGVIDADYRGPVGVLLFNHSDVDFKFNAGDRIAQLILEMIIPPSLKMSEQLKVKKLSENAVLPSWASHLSAGYDLSSAHDAIVPARGEALFHTDLSIALQEGTYARIASQSGMAWKHSIDVGAGVIHRSGGPVDVILFNHSDVDFQVNTGDRIARLIVKMIMTPDVLEAEDLDSTDRGVGGFGSTGI